jgi:hypothetical protein
MNADKILKRMEDAGQLEGCRDYAEFARGIEDMDVVGSMSWHACPNCVNYNPKNGTPPCKQAWEDIATLDDAQDIRCRDFLHKDKELRN